MHALVAQWIEHRPPTPGAAGSNPAERIKKDYCESNSLFQLNLSFGHKI